MDTQTLNDNFGIPGALTFTEGKGNLLRANITTPACTAEVYLHGAHLTAWQPSGRQPIIFLSEKSEFAEGKAIRGGVPVIFPWFGARSATPASTRTDGPSHGFARTSQWDVAFAAIAGDDLHLTLTLGPNDSSRALGYDHFKVAFELIFGSELRMRLTVANHGTETLYFEEALHTYFSVGNAENVAINGLVGATYLDKTDSFKRKAQTVPTIHLTGETDRLFLDTAATVTLDDPGLNRRIMVAKTNSLSTIVWNPWATGSAKLADMTPDNWRHMACIETANANENLIALAPSQAHTMESHITVGGQS
jgi:glucose-6-phosphate 1-epimerase